MDRFRRLLVALDLGARGDALTPGSRKALERAAWMARRVGASLTLFHSEKPDEYWDAQTGSFVEGAGHPDHRRRVLEATLAGLAGQGVPARLVVHPDAAWLAIVQEVLREGIDAVVASKRTDVHSDERRLGTVARKLLRKCPCAVWLEDPRQSGDPSTILAAADLTPVGDRVVELAASVAHALGAELHIVHAYSVSLEAQIEGGEAREAYERRMRQAALERIEGILASTPMAGAARVHVALTSPTQAVLQGVAQLRPGLVVMGTVSRGGIPGLLVGNTAERLLDRIDCALLAVKPKDFVCPVEAPPATRSR
jgi:universal stress protein E